MTIADADPCQYALPEALNKPVDLVNAREVSTVFQKEIIQSGRRLYCNDNNAVAEFELLTLALYQKLNEERKAILNAFQETGTSPSLCTIAILFPCLYNWL